MKHNRNITVLAYVAPVMWRKLTPDLSRKNWSKLKKGNSTYEQDL